jgi:hypothetical protein
MHTLLAAEGLGKSYIAGLGRCWARVQVLSRLSLTLAEGERVVVVGARASGKTTLLHCLTGLRRPDVGSVRWDARHGAPYRLCRAPADMAGAGRHGAILVELPENPFAAGDWVEALDARPAHAAGWLVFTSRLAIVAPLSHRALELRDGALHPIPTSCLRRVAEGVSRSFAASPEPPGAH